jgi:hypothetical protein
MMPPPHRASLKRQRCLQRLRKDRGQLLAKLRRPDARTSVSQEMQRLVAADASVDDLLLLGRLGESDYLEIVHALEDELKEEEEEELRLAEHMAELEAAELEAMLTGMDLDGPEPRLQQQEIMAPEVSVLCPICKAGYLHEVASHTPSIACGCGFHFHAKYVYHSVLDDFQDKVVNAFMAHR